MQPSMFNVRVPLDARDETFLMNTITDAQLVVSSDVVDLLDRLAAGTAAEELDQEARDAFELLCENGFLVDSRKQVHPVPTTEGVKGLPQYPPFPGYAMIEITWPPQPEFDAG